MSWAFSSANKKLFVLAFAHPDDDVFIDLPWRVSIEQFPGEIADDPCHVCHF